MSERRILRQIAGDQISVRAQHRMKHSISVLVLLGLVTVWPVCHAATGANHSPADGNGSGSIWRRNSGSAGNAGE